MANCLSISLKKPQLVILVVALFVLTGCCVAAASADKQDATSSKSQLGGSTRSGPQNYTTTEAAPGQRSRRAPTATVNLVPETANNNQQQQQQRVVRTANEHQLMADFAPETAHEVHAEARRQFPPESAAPATGDPSSAESANSLTGSKLRIVRLFAPEATQNHTNNVTLDCMFAFDKKLDRRLTIKWFFNDQVEPIYQWIPELNKRVYSDGFERFLDKSYEVSEDAEFMLQAYRLLQQQQPADLLPHHLLLPEAAEGGVVGDQLAPTNTEGAEAAHRSLLASRLSKLAKLGGRQSRQLLQSLRSALYLDEELDYGRFRALRLIQPSSELSGRYTCLVSSLEGEDMQSVRLIVYEPPKSLTFNVTRLAGARQYNLTCRAEQVSPEPALALYRFRAGPSSSGHQPEPATAASTQQASHNHNHHHLLARLASSSVRQEALANAQLHLEPSSAGPLGAHDALAWALVDESSLSGANLLTHFECRLSIEGTPYEKRQTLALQRGWHVNSAAGSSGSGSRQTLVGLFSAFVSLLCLALALISSALIFKLLRRHANNRVHMHHQKHSTNNSQSPPTPADSPQAGSPGCGSSVDASTSPAVVDVQAGKSTTQLATVQQVARPRSSFTGGLHLASLAAGSKPEVEEEPEGVYRVPDTAYGTRYIIGSSHLRAKHQFRNHNIPGQQQQQHLPLGLATSGLYCDQKPLYC